MPYQSSNPAIGQLLKAFKEMSEPRLEKALKTAAACFESWRLTSFAQRAAVASKAAGIQEFVNKKLVRVSPMDAVA